MNKLLLAVAVVCSFDSTLSFALEPIPDRLVVLTFDDSVKSQFTVVRPILLKYRFGATFFVTEGFDFATNKQDYMTWEEIAQLHKDGFEIGNHTRDHFGVNDRNVEQLREQLQAIADRCRQYDIPAPVSFAYPGNAITVKAFPILRQQGIRFARRGGMPEFDYESGRGAAYQPGDDHPLLIPSAGDAKPQWELADFIRAVEQAGQGRIAVLQFHGVPDRAHPWVNTSPEKFDAFMNYLASHKYRVVALRDLAKYVDSTIEPADAFRIVEERKARFPNGRTPAKKASPSSSQK